MRYLLLILSLCATSTFGQVTLQNAKLQNAKFAQTNASGGGGGGWTLVSSTSAASTDGNGYTTSIINTVGSTLFAIVLGSYSANPTPTSSPANTFLTATNLSSGDGGAPGSSRRISIFYCSSPTTSSSQTFTITGSGTYSAMMVYAFSGGAGGVLDTMNAFVDTGTVTTLQPGSTTPSQSGELGIIGVEFRSGANAAINSGFATPIKKAQTANNVGAAGSYLVQSVAAPINPTWTIDSVDFPVTAVVWFK